MTEKEIWIGALNANVDRSKTFFMFRDLLNINTDESSAFNQPECKEMIKRLKEKVSETYHTNVETYQRSVENEVILNSSSFL